MKNSIQNLTTEKELLYAKRLERALASIISGPIVIQPVPVIENFLDKAKEEISCCKSYGQFDEQKLTYLVANYMQLLALKDYGKEERI